MPQIKLTTSIAAPLEVVFDLSRSIDVHQISMQQSDERAIGGITSGLIQKDETVTWQARHLLRKRQLAVKITRMEPYNFFEDEMLKGDFKLMWHRHYFSFENGITTMRDVFFFEAPFGFAGKIFCYLFLTGYMRRLLSRRNFVIKDYAESGRWTSILS
ncbi:MAG TPA: SRPBCC family protein [Panacibacter sp.]|nr:SRPBCC family protein [Panacibacter sp.]HNP44242.1 SRPBCC family protein [Panacibacter sp.]